MIDYVLMAAFAVSSLINRNALPSTVAYFCCIIYQNTLFDLHSAIANHLIYAVIFIPAAYFATMIKSFKQAFAICVYSSFHTFYALDWLLNPNEYTYIAYSYNHMQVIIALCLIYFSFTGVQNGTNYRRPVNFSGFLDDLWNIYICTKASKRA